MRSTPYSLPVLFMLVALGHGSRTVAEPTVVNIARNKESIEFKVGAELVTRYHISPDLSKPYFLPFNGPGGLPLTRPWPLPRDKKGISTDHPHHKSVWFCHGDVIPAGIKLKTKHPRVEGVDFWSEHTGASKIVCTHVNEPKATGNHGQITTRNEWRMDDGTKILDETRTIHLYDFGDTRLFVFDIDLHASVVPIIFGDTKEGSFSVRVCDELREMETKIKKGKGRIENADGKVGEAACWGQLSRWCDYSGPLGGQTVGVAIFDDPNNSPPACWQVRGYGLMAANPFGRKKAGYPAMKDRTDVVKLARGEHLKLRYGILTHPGDARTGKVAEYYEKFTKLDKEK